MSENPDWGEVLQYAYENQQGELDASLGNSVGEVKVSRDSELVEQIPLDRNEIRRALEFMYQSGLVNATSIGNSLKLTPEGFNVAHERELRDERQELMETQASATGTLANFTIILGAAALVQALAAVVTAEQYSYVLAGVYLIILVLLLYKQKDWGYHTD